MKIGPLFCWFASDGGGGGAGCDIYMLVKTNKVVELIRVVTL